MDKRHILDEIRRTAKANDGVPLGLRSFQRETGIKHADWFGRYWVRWGDALAEAGFAPNQLQIAYRDEQLLERFIGLIRELGRFPVRGDCLLKRRRDPTFPSHNTFARFGSKQQLAARIVEYCRGSGGFEDVLPLVAESAAAEKREEQEDTPGDAEMGFVYLLRAGRYYKIGKTNAHGRRERELAIQLPEKARTVHVIKTDDPSGIEAYWHARFGAKRRHGEWFELEPVDVRAFRRRRFM